MIGISDQAYETIRPKSRITSIQTIGKTKREKPQMIYHLVQHDMGVRAGIWFVTFGRGENSQSLNSNNTSAGRKTQIFTMPYPIWEETYRRVLYYM